MMINMKEFHEVYNIGQKVPGMDCETFDDKIKVEVLEEFGINEPDSDINSGYGYAEHGSSILQEKLPYHSYAYSHPDILAKVEAESSPPRVKHQMELVADLRTAIIEEMQQVKLDAALLYEQLQFENQYKRPQQIQGSSQLLPLAYQMVKPELYAEQQQFLAHSASEPFFSQSILEKSSNHQVSHQQHYKPQVHNPSMEPSSPSQMLQSQTPVSQARVAPANLSNPVPYSTPASQSNLSHMLSGQAPMSRSQLPQNAALLDHVKPEDNMDDVSRSDRAHNTLPYQLKKKANKTEYKCDTCYKVFPQLSNLIVHRRTHSGERPFKCPLCENTYTQKAHMQKHTLIHTGIKPVNCEECEKKFSSKSNLKTHMRIHTKEKPFACDQCPLSFPQFVHLKLHKHRHSNERPFSCSFCDKTYISASALRTHTKAKTKCNQNQMQPKPRPSVIKTKTECNPSPAEEAAEHSWFFHQQDQGFTIKIENQPSWPQPQHTIR